VLCSVILFINEGLKANQSKNELTRT